jgi:hypothetical protein
MNCEDIRLSFIDYLDGNLNNEEEKILFSHIEECAECREEIEELKKLTKELDDSREAVSIPEDFMSNIRNRALKISAPTAKIKRKPLRVILIAAVILTLSAVTAFAAKEPLIKLLRLINPESRIISLVDKGAGNRLNISKIDKDIKITITDVVADDIQTLISFKIEDLKSGKIYGVSYKDGIDIKEKWVEQLQGTNIEMYTSLFNSEGKGTLTLYPIDTDKKTINLTFRKLETKVGDYMDVLEGNWNFEIPVEKQLGKTYDINAVIKVDHYTLEFQKMVVSPTLTKLSFNCRNGGKENEKIIGLENIRIIADGKEYKPYNYGHGDWNAYSTVGYGKDEMSFESMYFDKPKNIEIRVTRISTEITEEKPKEFLIKLDETSTQEFEYGSSKLLVKNLKVGEEITFDLNQPDYSKGYEMLTTYFEPYEEHSSKKHFSTLGSYNEVYYIDKENNKYDYFDALSRWDEIRDKAPAIYIANSSYKLKPSDGLDMKKEKFIKMIIEGYRKTVFVDAAAKVKLR